MECSEELGDMVKAADPTLALSGTNQLYFLYLNQCYIKHFFNILYPKYDDLNIWIYLYT